MRGSWSWSRREQDYQIEAIKGVMAQRAWRAKGDSDPECGWGLTGQ
jgi:hypothetical protein